MNTADDNRRSSIKYVSRLSTQQAFSSFDSAFGPGVFYPVYEISGIDLVKPKQGAQDKNNFCLAFSFLPEYDSIARRTFLC